MGARNKEAISGYVPPRSGGVCTQTRQVRGLGGLRRSERDVSGRPKQSQKRTRSQTMEPSCLGTFKARQERERELSSCEKAVLSPRQDRLQHRLLHQRLTVTDTASFPPRSVSLGKNPFDCYRIQNHALLSILGLPSCPQPSWHWWLTDPQQWDILKRLGQLYHSEYHTCCLRPYCLR